MRWSLLLVVGCALCSSHARAKPGCLSRDRIAKLSQDIERRNQRRLERALRRLHHTPYPATEVARSGAPLPDETVSTVQIAGQDVLVYAIAARVVGAGQTISAPHFAKNNRGEVVLVEWQPRRALTRRARACGCVVSGGGAPQRYQRLFRLPPSTGKTIGRVRVTAAREELTLLGRPCPPVPRRPR